jgi:hypothetical protein
MKIVKWILWGLLIVVGVLAVGFVIWGLTPSGPMDEALEAMEPSGSVGVTDDEWLVFEPLAQAPTRGFIFYPGGHVDYRSYAPLARELAARGYLAVITPMPLSLAVFNPGAAQGVIEAYPEITTWVISGHSLGGAMAANFAAGSPGELDGMALLASYPASSDDLTQSGVQVASIYATNDGLTTAEDIEASKLLLPEDTAFVSIEGGNHGQFGWYGEQRGDNPATISRDDQQSQVLEAVLALFSELNP